MAGLLPNNPFSQWVDPRRNALMGFSAGMLSGDPGAAMRYAMQGSGIDRETAMQAQQQAQAEQERNATLEWVKQNAPQFANLPPAMAFEAAMKQLNQAQGGDERFFGNIVPMQGADGKTILGQVSNEGRWQPLQGADGMSPAPTTKQIDTGTEIITQDIYGNELFRTPKQNFQEAYENAAGTTAGKATMEGQIGAPAAISSAENSLAQIDAVINDPNLDLAIGIGGLLPAIPNSPQAGTVARIEQLQGAAFLQAFEALKGGGQITEVEGRKATDAIARLSRVQNKEDFTQALRDLRSVVEAGLNRARAKQGGPTTPEGVWVYNPATGRLEQQ